MLIKWPLSGYREVYKYGDSVIGANQSLSFENRFFHFQQTVNCAAAKVSAAGRLLHDFSVVGAFITVTLQEEQEQEEQESTLVDN